MSATPVNVRFADVSDLHAALDLWSRARSEHATTPDHEEAVRQLILQHPGSLLLAMRDARLVGVLIAAWDGWRGNMYQLAIDPEHRRCGVGRLLVTAGEERLRQVGARRVTALVALEDDVAAAFWDALGYPLDAEIGRRVRDL